MGVRFLASLGMTGKGTGMTFGGLGLRMSSNSMTEFARFAGEAWSDEWIGWNDEWGE